MEEGEEEEEVEEGKEKLELGEEEEEVEMKYWVVRQTINQLTANCLFLSKTYTIHSTTINNPLHNHPPSLPLAKLRV